MSTAFTINYTNWQTLSKINEIQLAYSERRQVIGQSASANTTEGTDVQSASYWNIYQNWLESNCTSFVNHGSIPDVFTLATWRASAGLNANGFRRSTDGSSFSYGNMQAGDIIGQWIFDDLIKGFSALKKTKSAGGWNNNGENNSIYVNSGWFYADTPEEAWAAAFDEAVQLFNNFSPVSANAYPEAEARGGHRAWEGPKAAAGIDRRYNYPNISGIPGSIEHSVKLWIKATPSGYSGQFDANGDAVSETYSIFQSWGNSFDTSYQGNKIGSLILPNLPDYPDWIDGGARRGYFVRWPLLFVVTWNFTNSN